MPFAARSVRGVIAAALGLALLLLGWTSAPRAQDQVLNAKQKLLAGEPLPVNLAADVQARRERAATSPRPAYAPGRVIVKLADGGVQTSLTALSARAGARVTVQPAYADFYVLTLAPDTDVVAAAAALAAEPGVLYAEPDPIAFLTYVPNDPLYQYQWNFHRLDMERTWDINQGAQSSLTVAIIDSGMAYLDSGNYRQAPELAGATFVSPHDFIWDDDTPVDLSGHGTHVAGTVGERTGNGTGVAGMAFNVSFMPIKAVSGVWDEAMGAPNVGTATIIAEAIRYAADNGAKVINLSLGFDVPVTPVKDAITYAIDKGVLVAAAAGNSGEQGSPPIYPAAYASDIEGLIAVGAVDYNFNRAFYSNSNAYVEIAAPGGDLRVDVDNDGYPDGILQQTLDLDLVAQGIFNQFAYFYFEGTSTATPHVSGLAALLMTQGVTPPRAVEAVIERFATDVGPTGRDNDTGFGVINPRATIRGLGVRR